MAASRRLFASLLTGALALGAAAPTLAAPGDALSLTKISDTAGYLSSPGSPGSDAGGLLASGDRFGIRLTTVGDFDGNGVPDLAVAARDDDGGSDRGAVYILLMNADGTVAVRHKISDTSGGLSGPTNPGGVLTDLDGFGISLAGIGDLDGDGVLDLAVSAYQDDTGGGWSSDRGAVYVLFLNPDATVKSYQKIDDEDLPGELDPEDRMGTGLAWLGDLDGPGGKRPVLAAGAPRDGDGGSRRGAVYLFHLNPDGSLAEYQKISQLRGGFSGQIADGDRFGHSVTRLGDLDDDGTLEIAVGAVYGEGSGEADTGAVWILSLDPDGSVADQKELASQQHGFTSSLRNLDLFGDSIASLGDLDGDGIEDLAVGSTGNDDQGPDRGAVWLLMLTAEGEVGSIRLHSASDPIPGSSLEDVDAFGFVTGADIDGDTITDLIVGAPLDDDGTTDGGAVYVLFHDGAPATCGNGALDPGESCDDGNAASGDGCSATCEIDTSRQRLIPYVGQLQGIQGPTQVSFSLYDSAGAALWGPETHVVTPDASGRFLAVVGTTGLDQDGDRMADLDQLDGSDLALELSVGDLAGSPTVLSPRQPLVAAFHASTADRLAPGSVTTAKLRDASVTNEKLASASISGADLAPYVLTAAHIAPNSIPGSKLRADDYSGGDIADGSVTGAHIAADAVTKPKIGGGAVTGRANTTWPTGITARIAPQALRNEDFDPNLRLDRGAVWTSAYVNDWDQPNYPESVYQHARACPSGWFLVGFTSEYDGGRRDRRFKFKCAPLGID
jgi:cysteine-rich repeat protein